MKNVKRGLSIVLAALMLISVMAVAPLTAGAATEMYFVGELTGWNFAAMTANGDGTFSYTVEDVAAGDYRFKFAPAASWDVSYGVADEQETNYNDKGYTVKGVTYFGGGSEDINLNVENDDSTVTFTFNPDYKDENKNYVTGSYEIAVESKVEVTTYTVNYINTENWENVYCYTFTGSNPVGPTWPGTKVEANEDGTYTFEVTGAKSLIFNNNDGSQTGNLDAAKFDGKYVAGTSNAVYDSPAEVYASQTVTPNTDDDTNLTKFKLEGKTSYKAVELLGVQKKYATATDAMRFVGVVSKEVVEKSTDYGFVIGRASASVLENIVQLAEEKLVPNATDKSQNKFSCYEKNNALAGDYGTPGAKDYTYVSAAVNSIPEGGVVVTRLYAVIDGTTCYGSYIKSKTDTSTVCVADSAVVFGTAD